MSVRSNTPLIYLITAGSAESSTFDADRRRILDLIGIAAGENVGLVQIREKRLSARRVFELTVDAVKLTRGTGTRILVNDRADIAAAAKADGVHLTASSLSAAVVRRCFGTEFLIGASTHSLKEAQIARDQGADLVVFGPVFQTPGKGPARGLAELEEVCTAMGDFPVLALGGVNESNYDSVLEAGAAGFAAIRSLNDPTSLRSICAKLNK